MPKIPEMTFTHKYIIKSIYVLIFLVLVLCIFVSTNAHWGWILLSSVNLGVQLIEDIVDLCKYLKMKKEKTS